MVGVPAIAAAAAEAGERVGHAMGTRGAHPPVTPTPVLLSPQISTLVVEVGLTGLAGVLMGLTNAMSSRLYSGVLRVPYSLISPAPDTMSLPLLCFFINMAIGVAMSPSAVRVFGEDITVSRAAGEAGACGIDRRASGCRLTQRAAWQVYWRETASGHSRVAAFLGKSVAVLPRVTLASLHFSASLYMLAKPRAPYWYYAVDAWLIAFCVYALGGIVSVVAARMNASLIAVIASMVRGGGCATGLVYSCVASHGAGGLSHTVC